MENYLMLKKRQFGFTLAELLMALAILGVIATFTIPKIISAQQNGQRNAGAKEAISMVSAAFHKHQLSGLVTASTSAVDLTQYMNYVAIDTTATEIDSNPGADYAACNSGMSTGCLRLHNGGVLLPVNCPFTTLSTTTNAIYFHYDFNDTYSGSLTGPDKGLLIFIYSNGRMTSYGNATSGTILCGGNLGATNPANDPSWFSW